MVSNSICPALVDQGPPDGISQGCGEAERGDNASAFDHLGLAIRNMHDSGNITTMRTPLAVLAVLFDRLDRHEASAIIAGFALSTLTALAVPELSIAIAHLRDGLRGMMT